MRSLIIIALLVAAAHCLRVKKEPLVTKDFVDELNRRPGMTWTAGHKNGLVTGATKEELRRLLGMRIDQPKTALPPRVFTAEEKAMDIPDDFDAATQWPQCKTIPYIWDQSECGSCWAVAAAGAISDRYCTVNQKPEFFISARDLLSCCLFCGNGCNGGLPEFAWAWWATTGLTTEECQPYPFPHCEHHTTGKYPPCKKNSPTPTCEPKCTGNSSHVNMTRYKGAKSYSLSGEENMQRDLMAKGPIEVGFWVFEDFFAYKSGVYQHVSGGYLGGHAVRLVGWGVKDGVKYWKIANSWNEDWGDNGYFLIKRGTNECFIESRGTAGYAE